MKKRLFGLFVVLACLLFASCGENTGSVTLNIDDDVVVSKIVIMKYTTGSKMQKYSEKEIELKQGQDYTRTMAKGTYGYFIKAKGGPTYTKDKNKTYKIDYQYNALKFDILPGEETVINFSEALPNQVLISLD